MHRALALALLVTLALATPAHAAYYVGKPVAEHYLRLVLHDNYGYSNTGVFCRPKQGGNEHARKGSNTLYHRWACGFYAGEAGGSCKGSMSIIGSDGEGGFVYHRNWSVGEIC
jgi:hypothetical protein